MTSAKGMERVTLIAELSHNWNGDLRIAERMIEAAANAGADLVKIQCRTLPDAIPEAQRDRPKVVPWTGETLSYVDYRRLVELTDEQIVHLGRIARDCGTELFASVWDAEQVYRVRDLIDPAYYKIPSACATDLDLVQRAAMVAHEREGVIMISTGALEGYGVAETMAAARSVGDVSIWLAQCTATYPCPVEHLHLRTIPMLIAEYQDARVGFSNHGVSIAPLVAAVALGASWLEVHFTLDRSMPGTDQAASFEPSGLARLRRYVDTVRAAMGEAEKAIQPGEEETMAKLRRVSR